jgi:O-acetylhomoserine/O-acetylserine sulfhydrylase-like pyridoxal-dependent enzyme
MGRVADRAACFAMQNQLRLTRSAANINDHKTLILHLAR